MSVWGGFVCCAWMLLTLVFWAIGSAIAKYMQSPQYRAWKEQHDAARQAAAVQADKEAAREHLAAFFRAHPELFDTVPPALITAFIRSQMPDSLDPVQLWSVCEKKIAELQPLVAQERRVREDSCLEARIAKLRADHERRVAAFRTLADSLDPESREALEFDRLTEEEMARFKTELRKINSPTQP